MEHIMRPKLSRRVKLSRSREYRNLRHVVPSLRRQRDVGKVEVVTEAARYIDHLHKTLIERFIICGISDSLKEILGTDNAHELNSQHIMNLVARMAAAQRQQDDERNLLRNRRQRQRQQRPRRTVRTHPFRRHAHNATTMTTTGQQAARLKSTQMIAISADVSVRHWRHTRATGVVDHFQKSRDQKLAPRRLLQSNSGKISAMSGSLIGLSRNTEHAQQRNQLSAIVERRLQAQASTTTIELATCGENNTNTVSTNDTTDAERTPRETSRDDAMATINTKDYHNKLA